MAQHPYKAALDRRAMKRNAKLTTGPQANQVKPEHQRSVTPSNFPMKSKPCALLTHTFTHK